MYKIKKEIINSATYYSFKDLCNIIGIEPKERTRLGRKLTPYSFKITKDKLTMNYITESGIKFLINEYGLLKVVKGIFLSLIKNIFNKK